MLAFEVQWNGYRKIPITTPLHLKSHDRLTDDAAES